MFANITEALPQRFDFYHLGFVEAQGEDKMTVMNPGDTSEADRLAVGFSLQGDFKAFLVVLFDRGLDISTYTELGNILASQTASRLSRLLFLSHPEAFPIMISPPAILNSTQIEAMVLGKTLIQKTYLHKFSNRTIPVQMILIPEISYPSHKEAGHA